MWQKFLPQNFLPHNYARVQKKFQIPKDKLLEFGISVLELILTDRTDDIVFRYDMVFAVS